MLCCAVVPLETLYARYHTRIRAGSTGHLNTTGIGARCFCSGCEVEVLVSQTFLKKNVSVRKKDVRFFLQVFFFVIPVPLVSFIPWTAVCESIPDEKSSLDSDASQRRPLPNTVVLPQKKRGAGQVVCRRADCCPTQLPDVFCVPDFPPLRKIAVEKSSLSRYLKRTAACGVLCRKSRCP